jgi:tetratricopeptide (TPR) repeat protein
VKSPRFEEFDIPDFYTAKESMKKRKWANIVALFKVNFMLLSMANAQTFPEEARRHMTRGQTAVEMAKSPEEYDLAIKEFEKAIELAPSWPNPYYNLGLVQEMRGKYREAVASLKQYLVLAPNAPDEAAVQEKIYALEYKAEQILTVPDIIEALVTLEDQKVWQMTGNCSTNLIDFKDAYPRSSGQLSIQTFFSLFGEPEKTYKLKQVQGPIFEYSFSANTCPLGEHHKDYDCFGEATITVEVASRNLVKIRQKPVRRDPNNFIPTGERSCTFMKK